MLGREKPRGATAGSAHKRTQVIGRPAKLAATIAAALMLGAMMLPAEPNSDAQSKTKADTPPSTPAPSTNHSLASPPQTEKPIAATDDAIEDLAPKTLTPPPEPPWNTVKVKKGDSLARIFKRAGFSSKQLYQVVNKAPEGKKLARIYPGQTLAFQSDDSGQLIGLKHTLSKLESVTYTYSADKKWTTQRDVRQPDTELAWANGKIESSLFLAGQQAGLSHNLIMDMANIFGGVIDFALDPRQGDTFHVLYENRLLDGEKISTGNILALSYTNRGDTVNAFRYENSKGDVGYYSADGVSMRKAFLLSPVDFTRISSNFNPRRLHPIYKTRRPHRGTDYAASRGTPVYASGDGRVVKSGYTRANGNYVVIRHGEQYMTKYLHLHKRRVKSGTRVKQGQVIGTVGSTGAATGPHLHYEFLVNGVHRNPRTIHKKLPKAKSLPKSEMPRFKIAINDRALQLAALAQNNAVALSAAVGEDDKLASGSSGGK